MKKFNIIILTLILMISHVSCEEFVEGYDESPNSPTQATPSVLLTAAEASVIFFYTGQPARAASIFVQQSAGITDQAKNQYQLYGMTENSVANEWNGLYTDCMETTQSLIEQYGEENPYYSGMAKVIQAMALGMLTDYWGDVPYSEAMNGLDGEEALSPAADNQEDVLNSIQQLCSEAVTELSTSLEENANVPGPDDVIAGGDTESWIIAAHLLKARYANRLSKKDPAGSANTALGYLQNAYDAGLNGNDANFLGVTGTSATDLNQWRAFQQQRGYMRAGANLVDLMESQNDPRLPYYFQQLSGADSYVGSGINEDNSNASGFGDWVLATGQSFPLLTYFEAKFIEAEAALRNNDPATAATAYNEGVIASVEFFTGSSAPAQFINDYASETESSIDMETIMTQKYIAMFTQPEVWADYRRTGYPSLTPDPRGSINSIPERYPTALDERLYNENMESITDLTQPVWWAE